MRLTAVALFASLTACFDGGKTDEGSTSGSTETDGGDGTSADGTGGDEVDHDGDGATADEDCDDADASVFPGADEVCDEVDNDCDGETDEGVTTTFWADVDADGYGDADSPMEACALPEGAADNAEDCDDASADAFPGNPEVCDEADNNCDGAVDEGVTTTFWTDADGDAYGDASAPVEACALVDGLADNAEDCDDASADAFPGNPEVCDEADNNCDGAVDEGVQTTFYADADVDGYGDAATTTLACAAPTGFVADDTDCDDTTGLVYPGNPETCDERDNNCDGTVDEGVQTTFYADSDADAYGDAAVSTDACAAPSGYVADATDCDDSEATVFPGNPETCDELDNNCDGTVDEGVQTTFYADSDADSYGDVAVTTDACAAPSGYVTDDTDCDDGEATVFPGNPETCDELDNNCDGTVDEGVETTFYVDADGDGYGDASSTVLACSVPSGASADDTDCDDTDSGVNPGATEIPLDGTDQNCEGNDGPLVSLSDTSVTLVALEGYDATGSGSTTVSNAGEGTLGWTASADQSWVSLDATSGTQGDSLAISADASGLAAGTHTATVTVADDIAGTATDTYAVSLEVAETWEGDSTWTLSRDAAGELDSVTDPTGETLTITRDGAGRPLTLSSTTGDSATFSYNAAGQTTSAVNAEGTLSVTYDTDDHIDTVVWPDGSTLAYLWDTSGRVDELELPSGDVIEYDYSTSETLLPDSVTTTASGTISYTYDLDGRVTSRLLSDGTSTTYAYDATNGRVSSILHANSAGTTLVELTQTFDSMGRIATMARGDGTSTETRTYTYDEMGRLETVSSTAGDDWVFTYDEAGNRTSVTENGVTTDYLYDSDNRLLQAGDEVFEYDEIGRMVTRITPEATTTYAWDAFNRLIEVDDGVEVVTYSYAANGVRVGRDATGVSTAYYHSLHGVVPQLLQADTTDSSGTSTTTYVRGATLDYIDVDGTGYGALEDHRGGTVGLVRSGSLYEFAYTPFGVATEEPTALDESALWLGFNGEEKDPVTGLVYLRNRYYDPGLGRFVSPDQREADELQSATWNAYVYCENDPVNFIDPSGRVRWDYVAKGAISIATGIATIGAIAAGVAAAPALGVGAAILAGTVVGYNAMNVAFGTGQVIGGLAMDANDQSYLPGSMADLAAHAIGEASGNDGTALAADTAAFAFDAFLSPGKALSQVPAWATVIGKGNQVWSLTGLTERAAEHLAGHFYGADGQPYYAAPDGTVFQIDPNAMGDDLRGGIYLNATAEVVGDLSQLNGAAVDPKTGQLVLFGEDGGVTVNGLSGDMLITALQWMGDSVAEGSFTPPGVTIENDLVPTEEPTPPDATNTYHGVGYFGGIEYTEMGYVAFEADRILKGLNLGVDNEDGTDYDYIADTVTDYECYTDIWADYYDGTSPQGWVRFWIEPDDMIMTVDGSRDALEFTTATMHVQYEDETDATERWDDYDYWTQMLTDNYDGIAEEIESWEDLRTAAKAVALARYLYENDLHKGLNWDFIQGYEVDAWDTPWWTLEGSVTTTMTYNGQSYTQTHRGGASTTTFSHSYAADTGDVEAYVDDVLDARIDDTETSWTYTSPDGDTGTAVGVPIMSVAVAGGAHLLEADVVSAAVGRVPLALLRSYSSVLGATEQDMGMGEGWSFVPFSAAPSTLVYSGGSYDVPYNLEVRNHALGQSYLFEFDGFNATYGAMYSSDARPLDDLSIDSSGELQWTRVDGSEVWFDSDGYLLSMTEHSGHEVTFTWTGDELDSIDHSDGAALTLTWASGSLTAVETDDGRTATYSYDSAGQLTGMTDADGVAWTFSYGTDGLLSEIAAADGTEAYSATYDEYGRVVTQAVAGKQTTTSASLIDGTLVVEDGAGVGLTIQRDDDGEIESITDGEGGTWSYTWTADGLLEEVTDPEGYTDSYTYDDYGNLRSHTNPDGDTERFWWTYSSGAWLLFAYEEFDGDQFYVSRNTDDTIDSLWEASVTTDSDGDLTGVSLVSSVMSATYNTSQQVTAYTRGDLTQTMSYNADGQLASTTDLFGAGRSLAYDAAGRVDEVETDEGVIIGYSYAGDDTTRLASVQVGGTTVVSYGWDALGRPLEVEDADGHVTAFSWDASSGALATTEDPQGEVLTFTRDGGGRMTAMTASWGQEQAFSYDGAGRLASVTRTVSLP